MGEPLDLSIIIVNWNVRQLLHTCLSSVRHAMRLPPHRYEIIVVDNASHDNSVEMLQREFPDIRLIASDANLGFARGCQRGYDVAQGRYVLLLNPDTVVQDGAIDGLLAELERRPKAAIIGPRLINTDGSFQRESGGALPTLFNVAWIYFFLHRVVPARFAPAALFLTNDPPGIFEVGWVSGAAMLMRREAIGERIFDPAFVMCGEDMDVCDRVHRDGWSVLYSAGQTIIHHHRQSFEKQSSIDMLATLHAGPRTFFRRTHGRSAVLFYDVILLFGFLLRWPVFRILAWLKPGAGYEALARFSRQYVGIVLRLAWSRS